jgi:hypothetical protein
MDFCTMLWFKQQRRLGTFNVQYFVVDEIFLCEGYWLPSATTIEAFRNMLDL